MIKMKVNSSISDDKISDLFVMTLFLDILTFFANAITGLLGINTALDTLLVYVLYGLVVIRALPSLIKKIQVQHVAFLLITICLILYSVLINSKVLLGVRSDRFISSIFSIIVGIFLGSSIKDDFKAVLDKLCYYGKIAGILLVVSYIIYYHIMGVNFGEGRMGLSYKFLLPAVILIYKIFFDAKVSDYILLGYILFTMVMQGSRGPLLSVVLYIVMLIFINIKDKEYRKRNIILISSLISVSVLCIIFLDNILVAMNNKAIEWGFNSKLLSWSVEGDLANLNGRESIYIDAKNYIRDNIFSVRGMFGDYDIVGGYSHNIVLEIMIDFGLFLGSLLIISFVFLLMYKLIFADQNEKNLLGICIAMVGFKLFFSSSFWWEFLFFFIIAMISRGKGKGKIVHVPEEIEKGV